MLSRDQIVRKYDTVCVKLYRGSQTAKQLARGIWSLAKYEWNRGRP